LEKCNKAPAVVNNCLKQFPVSGATALLLAYCSLPLWTLPVGNLRGKRFI